MIEKADTPPSSLFRGSLPHRAAALGGLVLLRAFTALGGEPDPSVRQGPGWPRPELARDQMLTYSIEYADGGAGRSYERPPRVYVLSEDLAEPGLWGEFFGFNYTPSQLPTGWRIERGKKVGTGGGGGVLGGSAWQGHGISDQHYGVLEYFRPALYGLPDVEDVSHPLYTNLCFEVHAKFPPERDPKDPGTWKVSGHFQVGYDGSLEEPLPLYTPVVFTYRGSDGLCIRVEVENAPVDGDARWRGRVSPHLRFALESSERFPPADFERRIEKAIRSGADYLARHTEETAKTPWSSAYPAGVRALVAWAILQGGAEPAAAEALLERALRVPWETTYDCAFLVLALDALLERRRELPSRSSAPGPTGVAGPLGDSRKVLAVLKRATERLLALRAPEIGLWGYRAVIPSCDDPSKRVSTYCDGLYGFRKGQAIADTSNTFWALDALRVAEGRGVPVPKAVWVDAARMLERWAAFWESCGDENLDSTPPIDGGIRVQKERRALDMTLRLARRLRLPRAPPALAQPAGAASEMALRLPGFRIWLYSYSSYPEAFPFGPGLRTPVIYTNVYPSQMGGVGALAIAYLAAGADPLAQPTLEQGLLWAKVFFRLSLGASDIPPGEDAWSRNPYYGPKHSTAVPGNLGYNFLLVERVLDLLGIEELGIRRWFPLFALHALDFHEEDGAWIPWRGDRLVPTALFVLALSRSRSSDPSASLPRYKLGPVITGGTSAEARARALFVEEKEGAYLWGPEVVASLRSSGRAETRAWARKALEAADESQKAAYVELLVRVFEEGPSASKDFARQELRKITGLEKGTPEAWLEWARTRREAPPAPPSR